MHIQSPVKTRGKWRKASLLDCTQHKGTVAMEGQTLQCHWPVQLPSGNPLTSHPAPCHLVRELYKDHFDPGGGF